jgi:chaperonin cofactor prefoldin
MFHFKVAEHKKRFEEEHSLTESFEEVKKKLARDVELLQQRVDALSQDNDKLNKSKRNLQAEVNNKLLTRCC